MHEAILIWLMDVIQVDLSILPLVRSLVNGSRLIFADSRLLGTVVSHTVPGIRDRREGEWLRNYPRNERAKALQRLRISLRANLNMISPG